MLRCWHHRRTSFNAQSQGVFEKTVASSQRARCNGTIAFACSHGRAQVAQSCGFHSCFFTVCSPCERRCAEWHKDVSQGNMLRTHRSHAVHKANVRAGKLMRCRGPLPKKRLPTMDSGLTDANKERAHTVLNFSEACPPKLSHRALAL